MRKPQNPCEGCTNRSPECHADCKFYEWYQSELEIYKEFVNAEKAKDGKLDSYASEKRDRLGSSRRGAKRK